MSAWLDGREVGLQVGLGERCAVLLPCTLKPAGGPRGQAGDTFAQRFQVALANPVHKFNLPTKSGNLLGRYGAQDRLVAFRTDDAPGFIHPVFNQRALRLWWSLSQLWLNQCYREGYANVKRVLAVRTGVAEAVQVKALLYAASVLHSVDEVERAEALVQEALALARQTGDLASIAFTLLNLGGVAVHQDRYMVAQASFQEAAALAQQMGNAWDRGISLKNLVDVLLIPGEYERAQVLAEESLAIFRAQGTPQQIGESLTRFGWTLFVAQGDSARATSLVEQGLALVREVGHMSSTGWALFLLGVMRHHQGQLAQAHTLLEESLVSGKGQWEPRDLFQRQTRLARLLVQQGELAGAHALYQKNLAFLPTSGYKYLIADYLEGRGMLEAELGVPGAAAQLWGAAEALREVIGAPMYPVDRDEYAQAVAAARTQMGETAFAAAWAQGRALTPEAALATVD